MPFTVRSPTDKAMLMPRPAKPNRNRMARHVPERSLTFEQLEDRRLLAINPTAAEQELLQLINRFRTDPDGEYGRLFKNVATPPSPQDSSIANYLNRTQVVNGQSFTYKVNGAALKAALNAYSPIEPLVWNEALHKLSATHNNSMIAQNQLFHSSNLTSLLNSTGIQWQSGSELVSVGFASAYIIYAAYIVDWGVNPFTMKIKDGMQDPPIHRQQLGTAAYDQIGSRITATNKSNIKPNANTIVLVGTRDFPVKVTGAVFHDKNTATSDAGYGWYEAGEGLGNVNLVFKNIASGQHFTTTSYSLAGGYQIDLLPGTYLVKASGGALPSGKTITKTIQVGTKTQWVNLIYRTGDVSADSSEPNDQVANATVLPASAPSPTLNDRTLHTIRNNGTTAPSVDVDYYKYVAVGDGPAKFEVSFQHSQGNVALELYRADGTTRLGSSNTSSSTNNKESITYSVTAGATYYVKVFSAINPKYDLKITGPQQIDPDRFDSANGNNTWQTATELAAYSPGQDSHVVTQSNLSLHTNSDVDFFKYIAAANGSAQFALQFSHANGNIDFALIDSNGTTVLQSATSTTDNESIIANVQNGRTYYLKVFGSANRNYSLTVNGSVPPRPVAKEDTAIATTQAPGVWIPILANDSNPGGTVNELTVTLASNAPREFSWDAASRRVRFELPSSPSQIAAGWNEASYRLTNADGRSDEGLVRVFVVDFNRESPWQNPSQPRVNDVNDDGRVTALDALTVINFLNDPNRSRDLPTSGTVSVSYAAFFDTNGDNRVSAIDALRVVNFLNSQTLGEGEAWLTDHPQGFEHGADSPARLRADHDRAIAQIMFVDLDSAGSDLISKKRRP